ncbi:MAG: VWA domain-containing protein [Pseudomonadales bacterium]|nr:VWA domain-containing protein [Pseudomonadales bacterium]
MNQLRARLLNGMQSRIQDCVKSRKFGISSLGVLLMGVLGSSFSPLALSNSDFQVNSATLSGKLSQTKIVQGKSSEVYVSLSIQSPEMEIYKKQNHPGTDIIVVLDRSGSMGTPEKLPYAKKAVKELLHLVGEQDRFSLISFSDGAVVEFPLSAVNDKTRYSVSRAVDRVLSGGGTNIYHGIETAWNRFTHNPSARIRKVILLSDGEATSGDTSPQGLYHIASLARKYDGMLSTIGMGLGFNEAVMSSMADHGMGHFAYLESLEQLGFILARDFNEARQIFATNSSITILLKPGMTLLDAGGYPITYETTRAGRVARIATGGLISDATKHFVLSFRVATDATHVVDFSDIELTFRSQGIERSASLHKDSLQLTIVEPKRRQEAVASIDEESYFSVWKDNNMGRMRKAVNQFIRKGEKAKAQAVIQDYRADVVRAEEMSGLPLGLSVETELKEIKGELDDAFSGTASDQRVKQNRMAKKSHAASLSSQRKISKEAK